MFIGLQERGQVNLRIANCNKTGLLSSPYRDVNLGSTSVNGQQAPSVSLKSVT